jgi:protein-L-isoaspartate(D-aspartate) O-methyltransferase
MIPVGARWASQEIFLVDKDKNGKVTKKAIMPVAFVPLTSKDKQINDEF